MPPLTSQAVLSSMAKRPLLLLLAMGVLAGELWTEAQAAPYGVKLCGCEFIFTCGGSWWRGQTSWPVKLWVRLGRCCVCVRGVDRTQDGSKEPGTEVR